MFFWCFNCSKITIPKQGLKCQYCLSEAIEEMNNQNSPGHFIPYNLPAQQQPSNNNSHQNNQMQAFSRLITPQTMTYVTFFPTISFIRILNLGDEPEERVTV